MRYQPAINSAFQQCFPSVALTPTTGLAWAMVVTKLG
jgi:hypothetical protein